jgi:hypothetical protein
MKKTITLTVEQINALEVVVERGIEEFERDIADYGSDPQEIADGETEIRLAQEALTAIKRARLRK